MSKTHLADHQIHDRLPSGFQYADVHQAADFEQTRSVNGAAKVCFVRADADEIKHEADILQSQGPDEFPRGYYEHLAERTTARLAVRLRPPRSCADIDRALIRLAANEAGLTCPTARLEWYIREYNAGYKAASRTSDSPSFDRAVTSHAWDDGYLDRAAGRMKWHLTYCQDHDTCGEG